jgi:enhancing lycopene biosynthesis protein 2
MLNKVPAVIARNGTITAVIRTVVWIRQTLAAACIAQALRPQIADAMRPGVVGRDRDASGSLALNGKEHSVIVGCAAVVDLSDIRVLVFDGWVGTIQKIQARR